MRNHGRLVAGVVLLALAACGAEGEKDALESSVAAGDNLCTQSLHHQQQCLGQTPSGVVDDASCAGRYACMESCNLGATCPALTLGEAGDPYGFAQLLACSESCDPYGTGGPTRTYGSGTGGYGYGTGTGTGSGTGGYGSTTGGYGYGTGTGGTGPRPECVTYASVYCGCLGGIASDTCQEDMADTCDWSYDLFPEYYDCVVAQQCQGDWLTACSP